MTNKPESLKCLMSIAANTKVTADRLKDQKEAFEQYVEEERETHRLLDDAIVKINSAIAKVNGRLNQFLVAIIGVLLAVIGYLLTVGVPWV